MTKLRSWEDPTVRFSKLMAEMYYFMAKEVVDEIGIDKGEKVILSAIKKFGEARVKNMKEEALERDLDVNSIDTYLLVRDMPNIGWQFQKDNPLKVTACPMEDVWSQYGEEGKKLGYLYCQIDYTLFENFGMILERPLCRAKGDDVCDFQLKPKND